MEEELNDLVLQSHGLFPPLCIRIFSKAARYPLPEKLVEHVNAIAVKGLQPKLGEVMSQAICREGLSIAMAEVRRLYSLRELYLSPHRLWVFEQQTTE